MCSIIFFLILILFSNSGDNFNEDVLHLVFAFVVCVASASSASVATSCVGLCVGILSKYYIGNNLLLKLLRTFSLALIYFKIHFLCVFVPFLKFFNSLAKLPCLLLVFSVDNVPSCIPLKKAIGSEYLQKLQFFPCFDLKFRSPFLMISCNLMISFNLSQIKKFITFCGNIPSICFNLLKRSRDSITPTCFSSRF